MLWLAIAIAVFLLANVVATTSLWRLHPRRRPLIVALVVIGNVMWLFFPILNARTDFSRGVRAVFGPPWFAWLSFAIVYSVFIVVIPRRFKVTASRVFLWTTLVALVVGVYGALVPLRVEHVPIYLKDLPPQLDDFRIAEIADLHVGLFSRASRLRKIFATAGAQRPDVVVLAGDLIDDDPYFSPKLLAATTALPASIPLIAVLGNHEMYGDPEAAIANLRGSRVKLLVNEGVEVPSSGAARHLLPARGEKGLDPRGVAEGRVRGLWIAGISDYAARTPELRPNMEAALANRGANFPIVLAHQPKAFDDARRFGVPFTMCAHSHGGQCGFRPLRWSLAGVFLRYHMGLYRRGESQLYVNTGTGYWLLPWRLGVTPEITLFELKPQPR